jgi:hypothetical protein
MTTGGSNYEPPPNFGAPPPPPYFGAPPPPPPRPWWKSAGVIGAVGLIVGIGIGIGIGSVAASSGKPRPVAALAATASPKAETHPRSSSPPPLPASTSSISVPPVPNPDGKYSGTCDYTLTSGFSYAHAGDLIGEVRVTNTGNIGTVVRVRMHWTQVGYRPITVTKMVHVPYKGRRVARFHQRATYTMINRLQAASYGHECSYKATIIRTFGQPHG